MTKKMVMMMMMESVVIQLSLLWSNPCQEGHSKFSPTPSVCEEYDDGDIIGTKNMVQLLVTIIMMMGILKIIKMVKKLACAVKTRPERLSGIYAMSGNSMNSCYSESDVCVHSDSKKFCVAKRPRTYQRLP